ncbi:hypothetical protein OEG84_06010 [Hoeflea sp. G2-23]|uniref:Uncharacterized protein n=1 Tax=Hoeflea algicola TaxID=2983763 RepID=A0ABT3Z7N4_9HYPH|nr:hypothetical protein [Hoeflea algicola]MCY0147276.1 hypothetical protein [Hoeflea algicola]
MAKQIAVAVIHGIGSFGKRPGDSAALSFSKDLARLVRTRIDRDHAGHFASRVAWREIFYSDITEKNQNAYFERVKNKLNYDGLREFAIKNLGDAAAYHNAPGDPNHDIYRDIHARCDTVLKELEEDTEAGAPLIVLAHSMGGHVFADHIWDRQHDQRLTTQRISSCNTIAALMTFGCNIPLFTFAYSFDQILCIANPGTDLPAALQRQPWWLNFYDKDDVLGYPLENLGIGYKSLADAGGLKDRQINSGSWLSSWNPLSHSGYWRDADFVDEVADMVQSTLDRV